MFVAFQESVLDPPLNSIERNWEYYHDQHQFRVRVVLQRRQRPSTEAQQRLVIYQFSEENQNFASQINDAPDADLQAPNTEVKVASQIHLIAFLVRLHLNALLEVNARFEFFNPVFDGV